jgi:hypothetical protein
MGSMTEVFRCAAECAVRIEERAAEVGMSHCAEQSRYGVDIEKAAFRVRFVDCDGNRSKWLFSVSEVLEECEQWLSRCVGEMPVA